MDKVGIAVKLIGDLGGPTEVARRVGKATGRKISVGRVKQWKRRGVAAEFAHVMAALADVSIASVLGHE